MSFGAVWVNICIYKVCLNGGSNVNFAKRLYMRHKDFHSQKLSTTGYIRWKKDKIHKQNSKSSNWTLKLCRVPRTE